MFGLLFDNCSAKHVLAFTVSFDVLSNNPFWPNNFSFAKHVIYRQPGVTVSWLSAVSCKSWFPSPLFWAANTCYLSEVWNNEKTSPAIQEPKCRKKLMIPLWAITYCVTFQCTPCSATWCHHADSMVSCQGRVGINLTKTDYFGKNKYVWQTNIISAKRLVLAD